MTLLLAAHFSIILYKILIKQNHVITTNTPTYLMGLGGFFCVSPYSYYCIIHDCSVKSKQIRAAAVRILPVLFSVLFSKHVKLNPNASIYLELNVGKLMRENIIFHTK